MNDTTKTVGTSDKMKAKDFITLGIFTVGNDLLHLI